MSIYFFHLRDGVDLILDEEGAELADLAAARARAMVSARSILSAETLAGRLPFNMRIDVEDELGVIVHCLQFQDALTIIPPDPV